MIRNQASGRPLSVSREPIRKQELRPLRNSSNLSNPGHLEWGSSNPRHRMEITLRVSSQMDALEAGFRDFLTEARWAGEPAQVFFPTARHYFKVARPLREKLFARTILAGSDCLSLSTLAVFLAVRGGRRAHIGIPRHLKYFLHAVVVSLEENCGLEIFPMAGRSRPTEARVISDREHCVRLLTTKPFVRAGALVRQVWRGLRKG